ncbi:TIGR02301 family protein [Hyphococcus sp.]|uniref:TIGR02301 family protein n=1 Tax=Hyphococcus sp. TaxID=2038636 RepID=UPI002085A05B|nr:MAG: hypothetical protein DHS20C04_07480 [Marinicaulis sp.]
MILRPFFAVLILAAAAAAAPAPAVAQDLEAYQQRQQDLSALAELFGELHHLRRTCDPSFEADVWRERMKKLIDLEEPQASEREALVQQFNKGYRAAQSRYPSCDRRARDYAAARAAQGDAVVDRLADALREGEEENYAPSPFLISPTQNQQ